MEAPKFRGALALLALAAGLATAHPPPAGAHGHCGDTITPVSHAPPEGTYTTAIKLDLQVVFHDAPAHCGVQDYWWTFNGAEWRRLGTALPEGGQYVMRAQAIFNEQGRYGIRAHILEACCGSAGHSVYSSHGWSIVIDFCDTPYPAILSPAGQVGDDRPTIRVTFEQTDSKCPLTGGQLIVDGVLRSTELTRSGNLHTLSWTPPGSLIPGPHVVQASVTHQCCESAAGKPRTDTFTGSFDVLGCGENPHVVDHQRPQGTTVDPRPSISVAFRDVDRACGIREWGMSIDSQPVEADVQDLGTTFVLTYRPPFPLLPGPHTATAFVRERCCTSAGAAGGGDAAWTFSTLGSAGGFGYNASIPGLASNSSLGGTIRVPGFSHPLVPVSWESFPIHLPGPLVAEVRTSEIPIAVYVDPTHVADETRVPIGDFTTITLCPRGSLPCPAPIVLAKADRVTLSVALRLSGQTLHEDSITIPLAA